ncbi:GATOR complex protein WDR24-like [Chelonus insularis]|uniref:GATOR complex protein WDR24-like n=1 Tax=Chelonus insularis TaxID=460826 RepID=UPI00158AACE1|nr:GATOR complex protein WDR24-like [Chelonus insularis]
MVKPIEKKYQLAAHRRNLEERKFNFYSETAKYFERECDKAKQFNLWNADRLKHTHWENLKKLNALKLRRNKLKELITNENKIYEEECKNLERKSAKKELSFEELRNQLKERRAELSLYKPQTCRRIESYFLYPTQINRRPLKEFNKPLTDTFNNSIHSKKNNSKMEDSTQKEKTLQEQSDACDQNQKDFEERSDACQQNRVNSEFAQYQHFYDIDQPSEPFNVLKCMNDYREHKNDKFVDDNDFEKKRYTPNFLYGHRMYVNDENHPNLDKKYKERNMRQSLENTNISNTSMFSFDLPKNSHEQQDIHDECRRSKETEEYLDKHCDVSKLDLNEVDSAEAEKNDEDTSGNDVASNEQSEDKDHDKDENKEEILIQLPDDLEVDSDSMLMYLRDNALKSKIEDLETREYRASTKHLWEELLRLRDMKNRLELFREKQIYKRYDSHIDPIKKEEVLKYIEARSKQLKDRETICADSGLYSEEAKRTWNQWVEEDKKAAMNNSHTLRDILLKKLEDEWAQLSENDRKVVCQMYNNMTSGSYMQFETQLLAKKGIW